MEKATEFRIVFITTESNHSAHQISRILVAENLAACCTITPNVVSIFNWEGSISERHEFQVQIKTSKENLEFVEQRIKEIHSDDVPEIISIPMDSASGDYLSWLKESVSLENNA